MRERSHILHYFLVAEDTNRVLLPLNRDGSLNTQGTVTCAGVSTPAQLGLSDDTPLSIVDEKFYTSADSVVRDLASRIGIHRTVDVFRKTCLYRGEAEGTDRMSLYGSTLPSYEDILRVLPEGVMQDIRLGLFDLRPFDEHLHSILSPSLASRAWKNYCDFKPNLRAFPPSVKRKVTPSTRDARKRLN